MDKHLLTNAQYQLWMGQQIVPNSQLYNMAFTFHFDQQLDAERFAKSFQELVQKADALRLTFHSDNGHPYQKVNENLVPNHTVVDANNWEQNQLDQFIQEEIAKKIQIDLCCHKSILIQRGQDSIWFLCMHHLTTDATTFELLFKAFNSIYHQTEYVELGSFLTYAKKLRNKNDDNSKQEMYWREQVEENLSHQIYGNALGKNIGVAKRHSFDLGKERSAKIRELLNQTPFVSFSKEMTTYQFFGLCISTLLHFITQDDQLRIGSTIHNRIDNLSKNTAGLLVELYPILLHIDSNDTGIDVFQKFKQKSFDLFKNAKPGLFTQEISNSFSIVYNYINSKFPEFQSSNYEAKWIHNGFIEPNHSLRFQFNDYQQEGVYFIDIDYNIEAVSEEQIHLLHYHFTAIIDSFILQPKTVLNSLDYLSKDEKKALDIQQLKSDTPIVVSQLIDSIRDHANSTALVSKGIEITYQELYDKALIVKANLEKLGIKQHSHICIHSTRNHQYIETLLGCLLANCSFTPIPKDTPKTRIEYIVTDSQADLLVSESMIEGMNTVDFQSLGTGQESEIDPLPILAKDLAYILYTSGSTGQPKGVKISHTALSNYLTWANDHYLNGQAVNAPLFTSIGFDLTITSTFLPLLTGGSIHLYEDFEDSNGLEIEDVFRNQSLNLIKATPTHLELAKTSLKKNTSLQVLIVGGEQFKTSLANVYQSHFGDQLSIYNEYGPTEATVGCIVHKFDVKTDTNSAVPIGKPVPYLSALILNESLKPLAFGVPGELYLTGLGLAEGYANDDQKTTEKFISLPEYGNQVFYKTGDIVRINELGIYEYLGRNDNQVKVNGHRIELEEISENLSVIVGNELSVVKVWNNDIRNHPDQLSYCSQCGLPSNYPNVSYSKNGVCNFCSDFDAYQERVKNYFKDLPALEQMVKRKRKEGQPFDCMMLLSGGKDSTFALAKLVELNLNVLAYTFDNGFISKEAIANAKNICKQLDVEHVIGTSDAINEIFVDSLNRFSNVCNGCFKTIYTLSTHLALEKNIPFIVTGLSRGQFFETRLTEELFTSSTSIKDIDEIILNARKQYHRVNDAVSEHLDVSIFETDDVFEQVEFIDFYRFCDTSLAEMYTYLDERLKWRRPSDTGRSTNCLINQLGIYIHKKKEGYSNYAFPYSWDVRVGHKTRDESIDEINEEIIEDEVLQMMDEIGYERSEVEMNNVLVGYYEGNQRNEAELRAELQERLPAYMVPNRLIHLDKIPVSQNGKIDVIELPNPNQYLSHDKKIVAPRDEIEQVIESIWSEVLQIQNISVFDEFISIGGNSLSAIRITSRIKDTIKIEVPLRKVFEKPTIAQYAKEVSDTIQQKLKEINA